MDYSKRAKMFKALGDPSRLKIVELIAEQNCCEGACCACDLLEYFEFSQPALSHHMKVLEQAQILSVEKRKTWNYYTLRSDFIEDFEEISKFLKRASVNK